MISPGIDKIPIDSIVRSKRKTIALIITPEGKLVVRAPVRTSIASIEDLVSKKRAWVLRKMQEISVRPKSIRKHFIDGDEFLFLGKSYRLKIRNDGTTSVTLGDLIEVGASPSPSEVEVKERLTGWYRLKALEIIEPRCREMAGKMGCTPQSIKISHAERRWGSCSIRGTVRFSWRLVLAPPEVIDYVIVHELVHLVHHNHSKRFWNAVAAFMPDYQEKREWLRMNEHVLNF